MYAPARGRVQVAFGGPGPQLSGYSCRWATPRLLWSDACSQNECHPVAVQCGTVKKYKKDLSKILLYGTTTHPGPPQQQTGDRL